MKKIIVLFACFISYAACAQNTSNLSKLDEDQQRLSEAIAPVVTKLRLLIEEYQNAPKEKTEDETFASNIEARYEVLQTELKNSYITFVKNNPNSQVSLGILAELNQQSENPAEYIALLKGLSPELQNQESGKALAKQLQSQMATAVGAIAPDFTQKDTNNKPVHLTDFRGKYLLIDFWASWCGPCRRENPHVVRSYQKYKDKNFEILGVSLDNNKQAWLNAIAKDQLTWPQVSDLNGWQNAVAVQYQIFSIPKNLLLDPNGVIIAKNLRGEELAAKLSGIFD
ncbi:hypothetical protein AGMMS50262_01890 [Bacteroidia bacterium]|nr:hypothetical protein AGMMS50262_01890 [Bacteroidia bacterium]